MSGLLRIGLFVGVGLLLLCMLGCGPLNSDHNIHGTQTHEHNVHHDPQRLDIYIHRDKNRLRNPPPPPPRKEKLVKKEV